MSQFRPADGVGGSRRKKNRQRCRGGMQAGAGGAMRDKWQDEVTRPCVPSRLDPAIDLHTSRQLCRAGMAPSMADPASPPIEDSLPCAASAQRQLTHETVQFSFPAFSGERLLWIEPPVCAVLQCRTTRRVRRLFIRLYACRWTRSHG